MSRVADALQKAGGERSRDASRRVADVCVPWPFDEPLRPPAPPLLRVVEQPRTDRTPELPAAPAIAKAAEPVPPVTRQELPPRPASDRAASARPAFRPAAADAASASSLAAVLSPLFVCKWQEAVALVQAIASSLRPGAAVPPPEDILLQEPGAVAFASRNEADENPVSSLAVLLSWLLQGTDAPPGLLQLASDNACAAPKLSSIQAFCRELAQYERPESAADMAAVVARLRRTSQTARRRLSLSLLPTFVLRLLGARV